MTERCQPPIPLHAHHNRWAHLMGRIRCNLLLEQWLWSPLRNRPGFFCTLSRTLFSSFSQLEGIRFTHAWGGAIETCSRFSPFWGTAHLGKTAYVMGFIGLGVGASRFGARVILDILDGCQTERTALEMVRTKPLPFPPEPFRSIGICLARWCMAQADANQGRENLWLRAMNWLGLGFDS